MKLLAALYAQLDTKCECEHDCHFHDGSMPQHPYGSKFGRVSTQVVKTPLASFRVCRWCADHCLALYKKVKS